MEPIQKGNSSESFSNPYGISLNNAIEAAEQMLVNIEGENTRSIRKVSKVEVKRNLATRSGQARVDT
ncbi:MAG: hypothetical protein NC194_04920 [Prevotella sp.]|nr:hypothetical protein [Prevotella sp.]